MTDSPSLLIGLVSISDRASTGVYVEEMLNPERDVTIGMTMAGALTPAGLGGCAFVS